MFLVILRVFIFFISILSMSQLLAEEQTPSIGEFAASLMEPVSILGKFISTGSILMGVMCIFAAFLRYLQYRVNPLAQPLGGVVVLFILGLAFLGLPFVHLLFGIHPFLK